MEASKSVLEFLEQLRKERDELSLIIVGLERRLGIVQQSADSEREPSAKHASHGASPTVTMSIGSIPVGFFHNLSQARAAEKLLRLNPGKPLTTGEILETFRKSGVEINPKNGVTILYTTLKRNAKFERVAGKAWGLAEWYPENRRRDKKQEVEKSGLDDSEAD